VANDLTRSKGENFTVQELAEMASHGLLRVPEFQRSFRWNSADVLSLFDSILKGYPVGSVLLWKKAAPKARVALGSIIVDAPKKSDALWVVDGQQRITSLVNAVSPESFALDDRFRIVYMLESERFGRPTESRGRLAIPLPDLFDISRLLDWLQQNPDAMMFARPLQAITARLRDFRLPASVIEQADESVLRDIFDRINSAGKRLRSAEIFDAIHRASGTGEDDSLSIGAISDRISASTTFGRIDDATAYQSILIRRHPDITRDSHGEFDSVRRQASDFPGEDFQDGYRETERVLLQVISFLSSYVGVPHVTFLPYRFLILVLVRFFGLFPKPEARNLELLRRWFWISATKASELGYSGSTTIVRSLAGYIVAGEENESVQRLLNAVGSSNELELPRLDNFRTNYASSKIVLCAMWWSKPRNFVTGREIDTSEIAGVLDGRDTPNDIAVEMVAKARLGVELRLSAANRLIAPDGDVQDLYDRIGSMATDPMRSDFSSVLESHLISDEMVSRIISRDWTGFIEDRENCLVQHLRRFLNVQMGVGFESTPPLSAFDFDEDDAHRLSSDRKNSPVGMVGENGIE